MVDKAVSAAQRTRTILINAVFALWVLSCLCLHPAWGAQDNPGPPRHTVKLIFIHHSCGENWLSDENGGLGKELSRSNYFVSDTNYGWGPGGIGDRTDITDWPEWFNGPKRDLFMKKLYGESGVHSPYTRTLADPGGENRIILFKSCYPNSNIEGSPGDPPRRGEGLTVGNAKAIYLRLLEYFVSRPDKLFIAITAPPVGDPSCAANARAFNTWLATKWLSGYKGSNVAVFDFYNVLTGPDNHHRYEGSSLQYITGRGKNTTAYPSDDDHPSAQGNRKATREFVPFLNVCYNRWKAKVPDSSVAPSIPPPAPSAKKVTGTRPAPAITKKTPSPPAHDISMLGREGSLIDNFDEAPKEWAVFTESGDTTSLAFTRDSSVFHSGRGSLRIDYTVKPGKWATCSLVYPSPRDWSMWKGLCFYVHGRKPGQVVTVTAYQGITPENLGHYEFKLTTTAASSSGWQQVQIPWSRFIQPSWEGDGKTPFNPAKAIGVAFIFNGDDEKNVGTVWIDDLELLQK
jgi:hypothetical protein